MEKEQITAMIQASIKASYTECEAQLTGIEAVDTIIKEKFYGKRQGLLELWEQVNAA